MSIHVVKPGETLSSIAAKYNAGSWRDIYRHPQNAAFRRKRPDPNRIFPGDHVFIPDSGPAPGPAADPTPQPTFHGTVIWHDTRLAGFPDPSAADRIVSCDRSTPLASAVTQVGNYANQLDGLRFLSIMCHGYERIIGTSGNQSVQVGGGGLQLCRENLTLSTVSQMAALEGFVDVIKVYACAAAETHPDLAMTKWDGQRLFGEMALHTGATVLAADVTQWYRFRTRAAPNQTTAIIDFQRWEGRLWRFEPDGSAPRILGSFPDR